MRDNILRIGVGGPVGSGKTSLIEALCKQMRDRYHIAVVTNDIYTKEDQQILIRAQALAEDHIVGVETGGCPHTAIREDASMNLAAIDTMVRQVPDARFHLRRKRRRQPRRDVQPRARRPHDLRHRRRGRRENSAQGRPRHHALGSLDHQQDRPGADGRRIARHHAARHAEDARRAALGIHEHQGTARARRRRAVHRQSRNARSGVSESPRRSGAQRRGSGEKRAPAAVLGDVFGLLRGRTARR